MVVRCWRYASYPKSTSLFSQTLLLALSDCKIPQFYQYNANYKYRIPLLKMPRNRKSNKTSSTSKFTCFLKLGLEDVAEIAQNKVLIAAGVSAAIGQLSKPFTSVLLYDKGFDFKTTFQAGGFPSTHSSAVVATATCLALERGFSDSIFGLTVVYAGLVMYDAQGVRREVGNHAKVLNKLLSKTMISKNRDDAIDSQQVTSSTLGEDLGPLLSKEGRPFVKKSRNAPLLLESENKMRQASQMLISSSVAANEEEKGKAFNGSVPLKESIGHTEVEVIAGALLGFFVSLAVYAILK